MPSVDFLVPNGPMMRTWSKSNPFEKSSRLASSVHELVEDLFVCEVSMAVPEPISLVAAGLHKMEALDDLARPVLHRRIAAGGVQQDLGRIYKKAVRGSGEPTT